MKPEDAPIIESSNDSRSVSRRHFMGSAALVGVLAGLGTSAWGQATRPGSAAGDARLPDGTEFPRWE